MTVNNLELQVEEIDMADIPIEDRDAFSFYMEDVGVESARGTNSFKPVTDDDVDWILNQMAIWKEEIERREASHVAAVNRLTKKIEWFMRRFSLDLQEYTEQKLAEGSGKTKKITLPCGIPLYFRKVNALLKVDDPDAFTSWVLDKYPDLVDFAPKVDKTEVNKLVFQKHAKPVGAHVEPEHEKFYIGIKL